MEYASNTLRDVFTLGGKKQTGMSHKYTYFEFQVLEALEQIESDIKFIKKELKRMSTELDTLSQQVQETIGIEQSAIALIEGLAAKLEAIANDPAAVLALAEQLHVQSEALAAAVQANPVV